MRQSPSDAPFMPIYPRLVQGVCINAPFQVEERTADTPLFALPGRLALGIPCRAGTRPPLHPSLFPASAGSAAHAQDRLGCVTCTIRPFVPRRADIQAPGRGLCRWLAAPALGFLWPNSTNRALKYDARVSRRTPFARVGWQNSLAPRPLG